MVAFLLGGVQDAAGAVIPVTTIQQKISSTGGCSLQEAIYSANFDNNVAIAGYSGSTPIEVVTQCVPGSGDDIIVLPARATLSLWKAIDDAYNPTGPTATPIITSNITILAHGATLQRTGSQDFRLFAVGSTGHLTIRRAYIFGFLAQGGHGGVSGRSGRGIYGGGGGGMGAGGAIYVMGGVLVIEASTFEGNIAFGGQGGSFTANGGGGGGGLGGDGGLGSTGGGGGGGARGNGGGGAVYGGGAGGTVTSGAGGTALQAGRGGFDCGGDGGFERGGHDGRCPGGGGGGGGDDFTFEPIFDAKDGGAGHYGGGGGGGADKGTGSGGRGGFGGGGGAASSLSFIDPGDGGDGGFGGGGGAASNNTLGPNGDGGDGGFFAGNGSDSFRGGGGGAGLGGAIFNDSGTVHIRNTTFTGGFVGGGISEESQDGTGGGGAIFSRNGHLTVLNSTISGNVANFGGGILVVQDSASAPTSFVLENTIVAGNGPYECAISGFSIAVAFTGNLIQSNVPDGSEFFRETFVGCQGIVATGDPQLGPLQYNQGPTPTMAIASTSPAWNAADPATSLPLDQRRQDRPQMGGFDIGAFELCLEGPGAQFPCVILGGIDEDGEAERTVPLTMQVQPTGGGTTTPSPGTQDVTQDSVVALKATPAGGYRFTNWSPNVTDPGQPSTTVFMDTVQTVTASFAACACGTDVSGLVGISSRDATMSRSTKRHIHVVTVKNNSGTTITGPISLVLDNLPAGVTLSNASGSTVLMLPANSPYVDLAVGSFTPGASIAFQLQFTNPDNVSISYDVRVLAGPGSR